MIPLVIWIVIIIVIINISMKNKAGNGNRTNNQANRPMNNMGPVPGRNIYQQQGRQVNNQNRTMSQTANRPVNSVPYYNNNQGQTVQPKKNFEFNGNCAARYEEWQEVPNGCSVVTCEYCNAQNLVPSSRKKNYQCYFCWKNL